MAYRHFKARDVANRRARGVGVAGRWGTFTGLGMVSVIVPAYNAAKTIERTIASALNQTYSNLEVLVVDDGSVDETAALIRRMADNDQRIRLLQKENGGLVSARNHGIAHAQGEFVAPLDADDLWHPHKIAKQVAAMRDGIGLVYCWSRAIDENDWVLFDLAACTLRGDVFAALIIKNFLHSGAPLVRRSCVEDVGGYDATLASRGAPCCEDIKFNLDIAERYDFELVPEFLSAYRLHAGTMSTDLDAMLRSHTVVVDEVRTRHPELPETLFRWAHAHQHLDFGLVHLGDAHVLKGSLLLLRALIADPAASMRCGAIRIYERLSRSRFSKILPPRLKRDDGGASGQAFLALDPSVHCGASRMPWTNRRLARLSQFAVKRRPGVLRTDRGRTNDDPHPGRAWAAHGSTL